MANIHKFLRAPGLYQGMVMRLRVNQPVMVIFSNTMDSCVAWARLERDTSPRKHLCPASIQAVLFLSIELHCFHSYTWGRLWLRPLSFSIILVSKPCGSFLEKTSSAIASLSFSCHLLYCFSSQGDSSSAHRLLILGEEQAVLNRLTSQGNLDALNQIICKCFISV